MDLRPCGYSPQHAQGTKLATVVTGWQDPQSHTLAEGSPGTTCTGREVRQRIQPPVKPKAGQTLRPQGRSPQPQLHRLQPEAAEQAWSPRKPQRTARLLVAGPIPSISHNWMPPSAVPVSQGASCSLSQECGGSRGSSPPGPAAQPWQVWRARPLEGPAGRPSGACAEQSPPRP